MNKFSKLFAALAVVGLATSCSDEPTVNGGQETPNGDRAYVNIYIGDAANTRSTTDGGFENGSEGYKPNEAKESTVSHIRFVFYDESGRYLFDEDTSDQIFEEQTTGGNVEYIGKNVILVLDGLTDNNFPNYMLTIINNPTFNPVNMTMDECSKALNESAKIGDFVMSTSSYYMSEANEDMNYFANTLTPANFKTTAQEAQSTDNKDIVEIYVERLAAKVQLGVTATPLTIDGVDYYPVEVTLAGGDNDGNGNDQLYEQVYLKVIGWNLNATANESYLSKQLGDNWLKDATMPFAGWNKPALHRSYWGMATAYGTGLTNGKNANLNYLAEKLATAYKVNEVAYCYENTNTVANVYSNKEGVANDAKRVNTPNVTHAVLRAELVVVKKDGTKYVVEPMSFVNYRGLLYKESSFKAMILNNIKSSLVYYTLEGSKTTETATENDYKQFTAMKFVKTANGLTVEFDLDGVTLYEKVGNEWKVATDGAANLEAALLAEVGGKDINVHTDGATDYYIPIEHEAKDATQQTEGYYGVVRNHWYKVNVTKFNKVGHAVFEPNGDQEIIPNGPEDPLYYVGARINILAWRIVNQNTEL